MKRKFGLQELKNLLNVVFWFVLFNVGQLLGISLTTFFGFLFNPELVNQYDASSMESIFSCFPNIVLYAEICNFILISIAFLIFFRKGLNQIFNPIKVKTVLKYMLLGVLSHIAITLMLALLPAWIYETSEESVAIALTGSSLLVTWVSVGLIGPIVEELVFRGGLIYGVRGINRKVMIVIAALLFGLAHGNLAQFIYAFALGLVFGFINEKHKSILPSIIMHMSMNSFQVFLLLLLA